MRDMAIYDKLHINAQFYVADIVEIGSIDKDRKDYALFVLKKAREEMIKYDESRGDRQVDNGNTSCTQDGGNVLSQENIDGDIQVIPTARSTPLDPLQVHSKGRPRTKRLVGNYEKAATKIKQKKKKNKELDRA